VAVIRRAIAEEEARTKGKAKVPGYYYKSLGWGLVAAGKREEAAGELRRALSGGSATRPATRPASGDADEWTAAYFLDLVSKQQFTARWEQTKVGGMVWFYVGHRAEIEGRAEEAIAAYRKSVELGVAVGGGQQAANWAGYRLEKLKRE
jgi:hypothetical protein